MINDIEKYKEVIDLYRENNIRKYKTYISPKYFSNDVLKLLNSRMLFRDKQWDEGIQLLLTISSNNHDFFIAEKHALISYAYSNIGDWQNCYIHNDIALPLYKKLDEQKAIFNTLYNQSVCFSRIGQLILSNYYLEQAEQHRFNIDSQLLCVRARICNLSKMTQLSAAVKLIDEFMELNEQATDFYGQVTYKLISADVYFRYGKIDTSFEILEELTKNIKVPFRARILFEYQIVKYMKEKANDLIKWPDIVLQSDDYKIKAELIDALISGQHKIAKDIWKQICKMNPKYYLTNYEPRFESDKKSMFFSLLDYLKKNEQQKKRQPNQEIKIKGKAKILWEILQQEEFPISKEDLIEKIWNIEYDPSYDTRFYKLIQRLRSSVDCEIINEHGSYLLK